MQIAEYRILSFISSQQERSSLVALHTMKDAKKVLGSSLRCLGLNVKVSVVDPSQSYRSGSNQDFSNPGSLTTIVAKSTLKGGLDSARTPKRMISWDTTKAVTISLPQEFKKREIRKALSGYGKVRQLTLNRISKHSASCHVLFFKRVVIDKLLKCGSVKIKGKDCPVRPFTVKTTSIPTLQIHPRVEPSSGTGLPSNITGEISPGIFSLSSPYEPPKIRHVHGMAPQNR